MKTYYRNLTKEGKDEFARRVGTTRKYIEQKLLLGVRRPSVEMMLRIISASDGNVTMTDLIQLFHPELFKKTEKKIIEAI